jgi:pyrroline-5-carboxylate reductase
MNTTNIGIIGVGKLGFSLVQGLVKSGYPVSSIHVFDKSKSMLDRAAELGLKVCGSLEELVSLSNIIIISVRPNDIEGVAGELAKIRVEGKKVVSTAAFVSLRALEELLGTPSVYRAMPNIAAEVNSSFTALSPPNRKDIGIEKIFSYIGVVEWVDEQVLDALTITSSSTPAVVAELMDTFVLASLRAGVPLDVARRSVAMVFQGIGKLAEQKELWSIRNTVATPGGTTVRLLQKIYEHGVKEKLLSALVEAYEEFSKKLSEYREKEAKKE